MKISYTELNISIFTDPEEIWDIFYSYLFIIILCIALWLKEMCDVRCN